MEWILTEGGGALTVAVKVTALWVLWQCGSGIRRVTQVSDVSQLVDCLEKLKGISDRSRTEGTLRQIKSPGPREASAE